MSWAFERLVKRLVQDLPARRSDGWMNVATGMGNVLSDKVANVSPTVFDGLSDQALSAMFHGDSTVRKACNKRPRTALSLGVQFSVPKDAGGLEAATSIQDAFDELRVVEHFKAAGTWENLFGGAALFLAVDDGHRGFDSQERPLDLARIRRVMWMRPIDRRYIRRSSRMGDIDFDPASPDFGTPTHYEIQLGVRSPKLLRIHRDRLIIFPGIQTTEEEREKRDGWGISVLDPVYEALQRNISSWQSAGNAFANAQYVVYKMKNLAAMLGAKGGEEKVRNRSKAMEMAKSIVNAVLIDAEDEYGQEKPDFGQMPEMLDRFMYDTAAALEMPVTELFGRSPAGMNSTGDSDRKMWHASCGETREHYRPRLHRVGKLIMLSKEGPTGGIEPEGWDLSWKPLEQLSMLETADMRLKIAQADKVYLDGEVLMPAEVAQSRFRPEGYSIETTIDHEVRDELRDAELDALKDRIENPLEAQELALKTAQVEGKQKPAGKPGQSAGKAKPKAK